MAEWQVLRALPARIGALGNAEIRRMLMVTTGHRTGRKIFGRRRRDGNGQSSVVSGQSIRCVISFVFTDYFTFIGILGLKRVVGAGTLWA